VIQSIKAVNFQSLQNIELELGKLTVIVGPSSSGKSALTRAIKAVASNALDSDYITRGTKKSAVSLKTADATVTIERELGDSSVYKIAKTGSKESRFARLNRQVPTEVTEALGILPSTQEVADINFAGQFDMPYLLKEGSSSVARILGQLTNVSVIFEAVKEASKKAKAASGIVNIRKKDQVSLQAELSNFTDVVSKAKQVNKAEAIMAECIELQAQVDQLSSLLHTAQTASDALSAIKIIPDVPDTTELMEAYNNLLKFKATLRTVLVSQNEIKKACQASLDAQARIDESDKELHDLLAKAGKCPTCSQEIH
jgi:exonuclease SbcC